MVIVSWNTRDDLRNCLRSLLDNLGATKAEVIVVDNASSDGSAAMVAMEFPQTRLIKNVLNHGFAGANNQGMSVAEGRFILLLNPDTVVLDDVIPRTLAFAEEHPDVGVVGCQVMEDDTTVQRTCFRFPSPLNTLMWVSGLSAWKPRGRLTGRAAYGPWGRREEREVDVVSGMYMLVRREAIVEVGLMNNAYFVFAEEADWCCRFWKAGWRCVFAPVGRILHVDGGSKSTNQVSVKMFVQLQRNILLFHRLQLGWGRWLVTKILFTGSMGLRTIWWGTCAALGAGGAGTGRDGGGAAQQKARRSLAAVRYHLTGVEPTA